MRFALALVLIATAFLPQAEPAIAQSSSASPITELILERGPCFGTCPIYRISLRSDGTAKYTGWSNVERVGVYTGSIAPDAFMRLAQEVEASGFWEFQESYLQPVNDLPVVRTTARREDAKRKVIRDHGAVGVPAVQGPEELLRIQAAIDRVAAEVSWELTSESPGLLRPGAL
jgi:hypothetical protein